MSVKIEVSFGELIDKLTILEIKFERISDPAKRLNIERELAILNDAWLRVGVDPEAIAEMRAELRSINERLWEIEDRIRQKEADRSFDAGFVELARRVYRTNDERSVVKRAINDRLGSTLVEEKSYQPY
jgi:Family of unknown function (DUF6165)